MIWHSGIRQQSFLLQCALAVLLFTMQWSGNAEAEGSSNLFNQDQINPETLVQQRIRLTPGWNYISFNVIPDDARLPVIFADVLADIELVKNAHGAIYTPEFGIDQLSPVDVHMGYKVKVHNPVTTNVTGKAISPETMPIFLNEGWNLIPYLRTGTMQTDNALESIMPSIVRLQDGEGGTFSPEDESPVLNTLNPGKSYEVFVDRPDTLIYPANTMVPTSPIEVNTMEEAVRLIGLPAGQEVHVAGYYTPGDGGGGLFVITESSCMTDGGTCFGFEEHLSTEQQETFPPRPYALKLENDNIAFGTMSLDVLDNTGSTVLSLDGKHLHGHRYGNNETLRPIIDYAAGVVDGLHEFAPGEYFWRFSYQYLTSSLRLERQDVEETLDVHWFGAKTYETDPDFDNQPVLCQAINAAMNKGNIKTILLSKPETYEYFGSIELGDGLTLKGAGGTELVTATDDLGNTYRPVRIKPEHTRLRVKKGEALKHMRMNYLDTAHPAYLSGDAKEFLRTRQSSISMASGAMSGTLEDLVLDGNWEENQEAFQNPNRYGGTEALENELRNSPGWAGFVANNHGGKDIPIGQQIVVRNMAVLGYGSNGLLGQANNIWTGENVLLGNSVWNHLWYNAGGTWTNLTLTGFAWTHGVPFWGTVHNLVYERGMISPYRPSNTLVNVRAPDIFDESETPYAPYARSDNTWIPIGFTVDGFYIDGRHGNIEAPFNGIGPNLDLRNGIYILPENSTNGRLYIENSNGLQKALYPNNRIENVIIYETGESRGEIIGNLFVTQSLFNNIQLIDTSNHAGNGKLALQSEANWRDHPAWQNPQVVHFDSIMDPSPRSFILKTDVHPNAAGIDIYISNSSFNNQSNGIIVGPNQTGQLNSIEGDLDKLRVFFENVELNIGMDPFWTNLELFLNNGYFRNVTASNLGRTSEDGGTIRFTATGGETYIDIPTNLFWVPDLVVITEGAGMSGLYQRYEVIYSNDPSRLPYKTEPGLRIHLTRALNAGETLTFSWSASVRPFPDATETRQ